MSGQAASVGWRGGSGIRTRVYSGVRNGIIRSADFMTKDSLLENYRWGE